MAKPGACLRCPFTETDVVTASGIESMNMYKTVLAGTALVALAGPAFAATLGSNSVVYALGTEGRTLVTLAAPGLSSSTGIALDFGGAQLSLDAITYRPKTRELYGYDNETDTVFLVNPTTGMATAVATQAGLTGNDDLDFDFNNVLDAARIVTAEEENRVFFPNNMPPGFISATDLFYADGDPNAGRNPNIVANAYTNAVPDATTTVQYVLDTDWDILATLANNAGEMSTVGALFLDGMAFDVTEDIGFDILSFSEGDNTAYALLTGRGGTDQAIYEVPLMADALGRINLTQVMALDRQFGTLQSLATAPAPVPVPAALPLMVAGLAALGLAARRRRG